MELDPLPTECLFDKTLSIRVRGITAGTALTLRLCNPALDGGVLMSQARFAADGQGVIDLARQAPVSGSYEGVDAMGLFWSRTPVDATAAADCGDLGKDPLVVTLQVLGEDGALVASHAIKRTFTGPGVEGRDVRERGLVGKMFEPAGAGPHQAVLVLGGSGGGLGWSHEMAALLASHGFAALALAYFAAEGLPSTLDRIPLEYFGTALAWLEAQPCVASDRIAVCGCSRGGELALLLGASFPGIKAVVAYVPSGIAWPAYPASGHGAWTRKGEEISHATTLTHEEWDEALANGTATKDSFDWYLLPLRDPDYVARTSIPVETINGPVLMISGDADGLWPSTALTEFAVRRFAQMGFPHRVEHLRYEDAGHGIAWPNGPTTTLKSRHPVSGEDMDMGGTPQGTAHARQDSWPRVLAFLREAFE